jgi:hypothetical protein
MEVLKCLEDVGVLWHVQGLDILFWQTVGPLRMDDKLVTKTTETCKIWGSPAGIVEDSSLLISDAQ